MALTNDRLYEQRPANRRQFTVKTGETIYAGALVALESGLAVAGKTATGLKAVGVAEEQVVSASAGVTINVLSGTFAFKNSSDADAITAADIGSDCYIVDDETVAKTSGTSTRSGAGKVFDVTADGVWITF